MSDPSSNQQRNLKPVVTNPHAYSNSPSQMGMSSDMAAGVLPIPYQHTYNYGPSPHDPGNFGYQTHSQHYRPPQLHSQQQLPPAHHMSQHNPQPLLSPGSSRKRRASEIDAHGLPLSSVHSTSSYGTQQTGMMGGPNELDVGLGSASQGQMAAPSTLPVKKGRTNTPWTPAEEQRLKAMRDAGNSWSEIAKTFPTRTEGSVKKHWYKDMHFSDFAKDEVSNFVRLSLRLLLDMKPANTCEQSAALLQAIKDYENNKWKVIGQKVGKPAKACEQFAKEQGWKV